MCVLVNVRSVWCQTVGELRQKVPCQPVKDSCYEIEPRDDDCLCGVNIEATLRAAGVEWTRDECGDYHVYDEIGGSVCGS